MKIKNWSKFQTKRKDRESTPWIKLHRRALMSPTWHQMDDKMRGQFVALLLLADSDGILATDNPAVLQSMAGMSEPPDLQRFFDLGLLDGDGLATTWQPNVPPEKEREIEKELDKDDNIPSKPKSAYDGAFLQFWSIYPRRIGKGQAAKAFKKAIKLASLDAIYGGAERVAEEVANGADVRYIKHPATWLNAHGWEDEAEEDEFTTINRLADQVDFGGGEDTGQSPHAKFPRHSIPGSPSEGRPLTAIDYDPEWDTD